jgi:tripeptidyl-peptidase-1
MLVRTTSYSLPTNLHTHVEMVQPTTMFGRFKPEKSTIFDLDTATELLDTASKALPLSLGDASGATVDPSCNKTITVSCLLQLYNAVGYVPSKDPRNSIGITGYTVGFPAFEVFIPKLSFL